jgi:hypothetical protein
MDGPTCQRGLGIQNKCERPGLWADGWFHFNQQTGNDWPRSRPGGSARLLDQAHYDRDGDWTYDSSNLGQIRTGMDSGNED